MDDLDIDKLILDLSQNWTGYVSWKNIRTCLKNQNLGDPRNVKLVKLILVALGFAVIGDNGYLDRTKWTDKGIDYIKQLKERSKHVSH